MTTDRLLSATASGVALIDLFVGSQLSDCPLPCTTTRTKTKHLFDRSDDSKFSTLALTFSSKVLVTKTDFLTFSLASFLSEVGGSMGMWLGMGMVQAMELVINSILPWIGHRLDI